MLLEDILPMLLRLVTLGLEGMRMRVGSLLADVLMAVLVNAS